MTALGLCVAMAMATVLLWAGLAKFTSLGGFASTLQALGVPAKWSHRFSALAPLSEVLTALGVLFAPHWRWTLMAVVALGGAFALAGLVAMLRKRRILCNCFGSSATGGYLGLTQVLALPAYVGGASILYYGIPTPLPLAAGALLFAASGLAIVSLKAVGLRKVVSEARGDRLSAEEMYVWLPQR
jgi:Methylamine utilisation protein MauE